MLTVSAFVLHIGMYVANSPIQHMAAVEGEDVLFNCSTSSTIDRLRWRYGQSNTTVSIAISLITRGVTYLAHFSDYQPSAISVCIATQREYTSAECAVFKIMLRNTLRVNGLRPRFLLEISLVSLSPCFLTFTAPLLFNR
ncbi:unnamed protein product [Lampetra planeri]